MAETLGSEAAALDVAAAAARLASVEVSRLPAEEALEVADAARRLAGFALAAETEALLQLCRAYRFLPRGSGWDQRRRAGADEVQAASGWSHEAAVRRIVLAEQVGELPGLVAGLRDGSVDVPRAVLLARRVAVLERVADRQAVARVVLAAHAKAAGGLTVRQWLVLVRRAIAAIDPDAAQARQRHTRAERQVRLHRPDAPGAPAALVLSGPADQAAAADAAVDALARAWHDQGRPGSLSQLRYDAAIALLTGHPDTGTDDDEDEHVSAEGGTEETRRPPDGDAADDDGDDAGEAGPDAGSGDPGGTPATDAANGCAGSRDAAGCSPAGCACRRPVVSVVVNLSMSLATLLGAEDGPCELDRAGLIPP